MRCIILAAAVAFTATTAHATKFNADGAYAGPRAAAYASRTPYGVYVPKIYRPRGKLGLRGPYYPYISPSVVDLPGIRKPGVDVETTNEVDTRNTNIGNLAVGEPRGRQTGGVDTWEIRKSIVEAAEWEALGSAAAGGSKVAEGIILRREQRRIGVESGARFLDVTEDMRVLDEERTFLREAEGRGRNPHILYLGYDD